MAEPKRETHYGYDIVSLNTHFEGGPFEFIATFAVRGQTLPVSIYKGSKPPNREKGHRDYLMLFSRRDPLSDRLVTMVQGMDENEMRACRVAEGVKCGHCDGVLVSRFRHDYCTCKCEKTSVDGGRDYLKYSGDSVQIVKVDLVTGEEVGN
jgi:hypothetical protein